MSIVYARGEEEAALLQGENRDWVFCTHADCGDCNAVGHIDDMMMDPLDSLSDFYCQRHTEDHYVTSIMWYQIEEAFSR